MVGERSHDRGALRDDGGVRAALQGDLRVAAERARPDVVRQPGDVRLVREDSTEREAFVARDRRGEARDPIGRVERAPLDADDDLRDGAVRGVDVDEHADRRCVSPRRGAREREVRLVVGGDGDVGAGISLAAAGAAWLPT